MPRGTVHDEDDHGQGRNAIGYIYITDGVYNGNPRAPNHIHFLPFIQPTTGRRFQIGDLVNYDSTTYNLVPVGATTPIAPIQIATNVAVRQ